MKENTKLETLALDVMKLCEERGLTIGEVQRLPGVLARQIKKNTTKHIFKMAFKDVPKSNDQISIEES